MTCANLAFGFIAVWNLAYLGCLFDNDPDVQDKVLFHLSSSFTCLLFITLSNFMFVLCAGFSCQVQHIHTSIP